VDTNSQVKILIFLI